MWILRQKSRRRNIQIKQYCYYAFVVHSDKVSYDVPSSISCNEIKIQSNKTFTAWNIPGLTKLNKLSFKKHL